MRRKKNKLSIWTIADSLTLFLFEGEAVGELEMEISKDLLRMRDEMIHLLCEVTNIEKIAAKFIVVPLMIFGVIYTRFENERLARMLMKRAYRQLVFAFPAIQKTYGRYIKNLLRDFKKFFELFGTSFFGGGGTNESIQERIQS